MLRQFMLQVLICVVAESLIGGIVLAEDQKSPAGSGNPAVVKFDLNGAEAGYWLGLGLEMEAGRLEVEQVLPDSPAAKAGLKPNDVLLAVGESPIKAIADLQKLVQASEGKPLSLKVQRDGKEIVVEIKPERRPKLLVIDIDEGNEAGNVDKAQLQNRLKKLMEQAGKQAEAAKNPTKSGWERLTVSSLPVNAPFPPDLEVTIKKKGSNPTRIKVRQGAQTWTVGDNELDKLPESIRGHVARMLPGRTPGALTFHPGAMKSGAPANAGGIGIIVQSTGDLPGQPLPPEAAIPRAQVQNVRSIAELQEELQQVKRQLRELQEQVKAIRKK